MTMNNNNSSPIGRAKGYIASLGRCLWQSCYSISNKPQASSCANILSYNAIVSY